MIEYSIPKSAVDFTEEIKKSRFITYLRHTEGLAEAKAFWHEIKVLHPNAREPAGTAGKPMLAALQGSGLGEICAVTVRYYGGILLGTGGLVRAYGGGVQQALKRLDVTTKVDYLRYQVRCDYSQIQWLQALCEKYDVAVIEQDFQAEVTVMLGVRLDKLQAFERELTEKSAGRLSLEQSE